MAEIEHAPSTKTWEGAASPGAATCVRRFEAAWEASRRNSRPDPRAFLPEEPSDRPAVLLALLRSEIALRWEAGDRAVVESYRDRFPELGADGLVALIYEEFCLREEAGEAPVPVEYDERFPSLTGRLRRVFEIHDLIGSGSSAALRMTSTPEVAFPDSGQTIAGFKLLEELGRGSFARVFLSEERQLADRPVALKVSRTGSREPQTLARLQHTHIVPVHSTRTDPATGLHLLCMPYFGRVTLERLLGDPAVKIARTGADVLAALDRLEPSRSTGTTTARSHFGRLPYARALAWWGARMAEALSHAHERGVLHRDIKPSNVLVTADGLPMLLDFNLARDPYAEGADPSLGGTLAYMAPEHIEALAAGDDREVDHRADLYGLGVLLFEALTGRRPFAIPTGATSVADALRTAAEARKVPPPSIRDRHPEMPAALEAVVLKCLAVDPGARHPNASALAADLRAVADDSPLIHAREPFASRAVRWSRRRRWPIAMGGLMALGWVFLSHSFLHAWEDQGRTASRISGWIAEGEVLEKSGQHERALVKFTDAAQLAEMIPDYRRQPPLLARHDVASARRRDSLATLRALRDADRLATTREFLQARGIASFVPETLAAIDAALAPYLQPEGGGQAPLASLDRLEPVIGGRVRRDADVVLFLRTLLLARRDGGDLRRAVATCGVGERLAEDTEAWSTLRGLLTGRRLDFLAPGPAETASASTSRLFGLLADSQGHPAEALAWLERAARLDRSLEISNAGLARLSAHLGRFAEAYDYATRPEDRERSPGSTAVGGTQRR